MHHGSIDIKNRTPAQTEFHNLSMIPQGASDYRLGICGHVCSWASDYLTYVYLNWYLLILLNIVAFLYGTHAPLVVYYHRRVNVSWVMRILWVTGVDAMW
jgi:hypothetical protein